MLVGGSKFSAEAAKRVRPVFDCQLQQVFGMAEGLVNYTRLDDPDEIVIYTQGRPMSPYDEVKIVDNEDQELPIGETGHLLTRGPYTIQGYYKAPEHNEKAFTKDGFYRTGDIVRCTKDGYLIVEGRAKDQINRGGEKSRRKKWKICCLPTLLSMMRQLSGCLIIIWVKKLCLHYSKKCGCNETPPKVIFA